MGFISNIWKDLREQSPECYQFIIRLAQKNYETGRDESEQITAANKSSIHPALDKGILLSKGERVSFSDATTRYEAIVRYVAEELLEPNWNDPQLFANAIHTISRDTGKYDSELIGTALAILHNENNKDLIELISTEADGGDHFWDFYHPFIKALPNLVTSALPLKRALASIRKATESDGTGGMIFGAVESFSENQPKIAETLHDLLVTESDEMSSPLIAPTLSGLSRTDFKRAHRKAIELSCSRKVELALAGIIALSILKYGEADRQTELSETLERFAQMSKTTLERRASTLAIGYGNLIESGINVGNILADLSRRQQPQVQASIATVLFRRVDDSADTAWFKAALLNLKTTKPEYKGIINEIDMTLYGLLKKETDLVFQFLEAWITNHDYGHGTEENELPSMMSSTTHRLFDYSAALEKWITCWFNSNDRRLHQAAADLSAEYCRERPKGTKRQIILSHEVLNKCSEDDVIFILQKVLGYVILQGEVQSSLVFSILRREPCSKVIQTEVYYVFVKYIAYNFPGSAMDYIREKSISGGAIEKKIAKRIIEKMDPYYDSLIELPRLKELEPPESRMNMYRKKRWEENKRITELAHDKSVLLKLITTIPLKYGKSFFFKSEGEYSDKSGLSQITTSFEIPRGEYLDPVGQAILRFNWRNLTREIRE